jgi:hypothetical protein
LLARLSADFGDDDLCAIARAVARPMPVPAPVISAILPVIRAISKLPYRLSSRIISSGVDSALREMTKLIGVSPTYLSKIERNAIPTPGDDEA